MGLIALNLFTTVILETFERIQDTEAWKITPANLDVSGKGTTYTAETVCITSFSSCAHPPLHPLQGLGSGRTHIPAPTALSTDPRPFITLTLLCYRSFVSCGQSMTTARA